MAAASPVHVRMVVPPDPWTAALNDEGRVRVTGLTWDALSDIGDAPGRFIATHKEDSHVGENGVRRLALDVIAGKPGNALPVWFGREHMQRNLIVRKDSSLTHPKDLAGKRIGTRLTIDSGTGAGVLMMLEAAYGLDLRHIVWQTRSPEQPKLNKMGLRLEPGAGEDTDLFQELRQGKVDAVMITTGPRYWSMFGGSGDKGDEVTGPFPDLRPLVSDPSLIAETYRRSGLYPITDVTVMKADLARDHADLPAKIVDAFSQANALASNYRSAEEQALAEREVALLGEDPHLYGMTPLARKNLAVLLDLFYRLGSIERQMEPEELFVPSVARAA